MYDSDHRPWALEPMRLCKNTEVVSFRNRDPVARYDSSVSAADERVRQGTLGECWVAGDGTGGECRRLAGGSSASGRLTVRGAAVGHAIVKGGRVHGDLKVALRGD